MNKSSVTKHNELIQAGYRLSLNEARIVLYGVSLINPLAKDFPLKYRIDIKEFTRMFNFGDNKDAYKRIKEIVMGKFWEREFTIDLGQAEKHRLRWLTGIKYADKKGYLEVSFNPELEPFLHQLVSHFTSYNLDKISGFKKIYSVRFYEVSLMHLNKSSKNKFSFDMTIEAIKDLLGITEKYHKFSNFKAYVLDSSTKEINKHSDINLSYTVKKLGRYPHEILFTVRRKIPKQEVKTLGNNTLSPPIIEKATWLAEGARTGWDVKELERQFWEYAKKKGRPKDIENAFVGFVKKKIATPV